METPTNLHHSIQEGDCVTSLDLRDAHLHVPIHPSSTKFLRFLYQDEVFQFRVLPFGLSVSPRVFTWVVDAMIAHVRSLGVQIHHYLGDWLLRNQQVDHLGAQTQSLLHLTARLGRIPNLEKSELTPTQDCLYWHTLSHRPRADVPSDGLMQRSSQSCSSNSSGLSLTVGEASVIVRFVASRPSQISASSALPISSLVPQSGSVSGQDSFGSPFLGPISEMVDKASQRFSGEAHAGSRSAAGNVHGCLHQRLGSPLWQSGNSRSMASCRNNPPHKRVRITGHSDGSAPLSTSDQRQGSDVPLRQQLSSCLPAEPGGTHSLPTFHLTWEILLECQQHIITLLVRHIRS